MLRLVNAATRLPQPLSVWFTRPESVVEPVQSTRQCSDTIRPISCGYPIHTMTTPGPDTDDTDDSTEPPNSTATATATDEGGGAVIPNTEADADDLDRVHLKCSRCDGPMFFDADTDEDPHACMCSGDDEPDAYRIMDKSEALDRAAEFL